MSQNDDATIERVAREPSPWPAKVQLGAHVFQNSYDDGSYYCYELRASVKFADPAALSAMPQRELLREAEDDAVRLHKLATDRFEEIIVLKARLAEALDVLTPFAVGARSIDVDPPGDHEPSHGRGSVTAGDLRRARAAADKIRAALDKGEPKR